MREKRERLAQPHLCPQGWLIPPTPTPLSGQLHCAAWASKAQGLLSSVFQLMRGRVRSHILMTQGTLS